VKGQKCYIIDCNAGTGYNKIKNQTKKLLGSPLLALELFKNDKKRNLTLYLVEKEKINHETLRSNCIKYIKENNLPLKLDNEILIYNLDWSSAIEDILNNSQDGIRLIFLDPYAIKSLPWSKLNFLIKKGISEFGYRESGIEILVNWAWHAIRRKLGKYYSYTNQKSETKDLSAPKEIQILDDFFGPINWKKIVDEYPKDIFKANKDDKIEELRDKLIIAYVKEFFTYFKYVKIHSVFSRKKTKQNHIKIRGKVKYFLIFASNYQPALEIIDKPFEKYRNKMIFSDLPKSQTYLSDFVSNTNKKLKVKKKPKISIDDKINNLEQKLGIEFFDKSREIIRFLGERKNFDFGCFDFVLFNKFDIVEDSYIPFLIENEILNIRQKKSWRGNILNYYYLCHPILVDRNDYLILDEKKYLVQEGDFKKIQ
jgi:three-Cys-motif partner protein